MSRIRTPLDTQFAELLKKWCEAHDEHDPSGAIVIPFYNGGFSIQYLGDEDMDEYQLVERLARILAQVAVLPWESSTQ